MLNISEGGALIGPISNFPQGTSVSFVLSIPQFPQFSNFTLPKLKEFSIDLFPKKVIRAKAKAVRLVTGNGEVKEILYGLEFTEIDKHNQKIIQNYVQTFLANIVHLMCMIDMVNFDQESLEMVYELAEILGYQYEGKIALLRQIAFHDYRSLQWL